MKKVLTLLTVKNCCRNDYKDYAEICFKEFGDRVKHWITFNEPWTFCSMGYASGIMAPGRCSSWEVGKCRVGDSGREPYTACHHQLLAHAETVRLYKEKYQFTEGNVRQLQFIRDNNLNRRSAKLSFIIQNYLLLGIQFQLGPGGGSRVYQ